MRTMHYDPVKLLVDDLVTRIKEQGTGKSIFSNDNSERFELSPEKFQQIKITKEIEKLHL